jgi:transposase
MVTPTGSRRDFKAMTERRLRAAEYFSADQMTQADISRELKVSRQSVSRWYHDWKQHGMQALEGAGRAGRKTKLSRKQQGVLAAALRRGARAHGFDSDRWTLDRVRALIETVTGIAYHRGHVWRIIRSMGWTFQRGRLS